MLSSAFKFVLRNDSGIAVNGVVVEYKPWKFGTDGAMVFGTPEILTQSVSVADNAQGDIASVNNAVNLNLGAHLRITFPATASATGDVKVYLVHHGVPVTTTGQLQEVLVAATDITTQKDYQAEI